MYEWEQSLEDLDLYIDPPPGLRASQVHCEIRARHLVLGIKGNKPFLDEDFVSPVFVEESVWVIEDGVLHLNLRKVHRGETWKGVFKGHVEVRARRGRGDGVARARDSRRGRCGPDPSARPPRPSRAARPAGRGGGAEEADAGALPTRASRLRLLRSRVLRRRARPSVVHGRDANDLMNVRGGRIGLCECVCVGSQRSEK